ncbi:MAG: (Fe-S)-binding protein [Dehalococcoidia bacterium]
MISSIIFAVFLIAALAIFGRTMAGRFVPLLLARGENRFDNLVERIKGVQIFAFGQKKFLKGEQPAGIMHFLIFWGFMIIGLRTTTLFVRGFYSDFNFPGFDTDLLGGPYLVVKDLVALAVIAAVSLALTRWLFLHPPRLFGFKPAEGKLAGQSHWEALLILSFIGGIMVTDFLYDGGRFVYDADNPSVADEETWSPISATVGGLLDFAGDRPAEIISNTAWWIHIIIIVSFLNLLPRSKHFHVITAIPNVFFRKLRPDGALKKAEPDKTGAVGTSYINRFNWKQVLDMYSCTECGRCSSVCPATASGSPLAPRQLLVDLRDYLYQNQDKLGVKTLVRGEERAAPVGENVVGPNLIHDDVLWGCTTCMACEQACPVLIEYVDKIVDMRRHLVEEGRMEPGLQTALMNLMRQGNSFGQSDRLRAKWTQGLDFQVKDIRKEPAEYLWFVGDNASYDQRLQEISRTVARVLHRLGVDFGIMYEDERNSGNDVRRVGEEGLFEMLATHNIEVMKRCRFKAIFTTDPHSHNTIKNEYNDLAEEYRVPDVYHYTELLAKLLEEGQLRPQRKLSYRVTYHDPCYAARYNQVIDAPRRVLKALGVELVDMPRCGENTFCCGAGGGRIWMDDSALTERPSEQRIHEAMSLGDIQYFVVSCPKDVSMYTDAVKTSGHEGQIEVKDIIDLVEEALGEPVAAAAATAASQPESDTAGEEAEAAE